MKDILNNLHNIDRSWWGVERDNDEESWENLLWMAISLDILFHCSTTD